MSGNLKEIIDLEVENVEYSPTPDDAVESVLEFLRQWAMYYFPRYITAVDAIQTEILGQRGMIDSPSVPPFS